MESAAACSACKAAAAATRSAAGPRRISRTYYLHDVEIEVGGWWKKTTVGFMPELSKNGHGFVGRHGFFDRFSFVKFEQPKTVIEFGNHL